MIWFLLAVLIVIIGVTLVLRGSSLSHLDSDPLPPAEYSPSPAQREALRMIRDMNRAGKGLRGRARLNAMRDFMDRMSDGLDLTSEFRAAQDSGPRGEWVIAPNAQPERRILYIHGGAWMAGSPKSHRAITDRLSQLANAAVFAVDYRLMPEHRYRDGLRDCQSAYQWLLANGPDGPAPAQFMAVAGDSAGGNHSLSLIAWVKEQDLQQPDAAVALSPATDLTFTAPSLRNNLGTDALLGPAFKPLTRFPLPLLWWGTFLFFRMSPSNPLLSPLRADLSGLPPTLIHVSDTEMLVDDARRYTRKARAAGSPVELRIWPGMFHVWHIFTPQLPEADDALKDIGDFLNQPEQLEAK
jgi:acetyl esterase/lipase